MASRFDSNERFRIGRVFSTTFQSLLDRWQVVGGFALIVGGVTAVVSGLTAMQAFSAVNLADPSRALALFSSPFYYAATLFSLFSTSFLQAGALHAFLARDGDEGVTIGGCFAAAVRLVLPMLGLTILYFLAVGIGWVLFLVPGMMIGTIWSLAAAARVAEPIGVFEAFGRSRALTSGMRWPIFGCILLFILAYMLIAGVVQGVGFVGVAASGQISPMTLVIYSSVISLVMGLLLNSFLAALYREALLVKEGGGTRGLAEIFA